MKLSSFWRVARRVVTIPLRVSALERQVSPLRSEVEFLWNHVTGEAVDLVDFGDVRLYMFVDDNLYRIAVPEQFKQFALPHHYEQIRKGTVPLPAAAQVDLGSTCEPRFTMEIVLDHYFQCGLPVTLIDIGAFVGDFALRMASFARAKKKPYHAICFDPSLAGKLISPNIALNELQDFVEFEKSAIAPVAGPLMFTQRPGYSDSGAMCDGANAAFRYLVNAERLAPYLRRRNVSGPLVVKIDTEGLDRFIVRDVRETLGDNHTLIFEYTPFQASPGEGDESLLPELVDNYYLFDLHYLPCPTRAALITPQDLAKFTDEVSQRLHHYTDVLAIPKSLPRVEHLVARLRTLQVLPGHFNMIYDGSAPPASRL